MCKQVNHPSPKLSRPGSGVCSGNPVAKAQGVRSYQSAEDGEEDENEER